MLDPDRFVNRTTPGAHEWWYFDAISHDGRDALVIIFYAGLPFDPAYGVATRKHLRNPTRYPQPRALDHAAIGLSWYRDGRTVAYALNGHRAEAFHHQPDPFRVAVATSHVERAESGYRLVVATPSVEGRPIHASIQFQSAAGTVPFERNLGTPEAPHDWILAAADCRVEGRVSIGDQAVDFEGRGYHDHNAGAEDLTVAMDRWEWGRVHRGPDTDIFYHAEPKHGPPQTLWITCTDGRPTAVREVQVEEVGGRKRNVFGVRHAPTLKVHDGAHWSARATGPCVDDGPFYRRWLADFTSEGSDTVPTRGIAELLDTRHLHWPLFNWMIPYRLKRPDGG